MADIDWYNRKIKQAQNQIVNIQERINLLEKQKEEYRVNLNIKQRIWKARRIFRMQNEITDMTATEAEQYFGEKLWKKMLVTGLLSGVTGLINNEGKFVFYKHDLQTALRVAKEKRKPYPEEFD